MTAKSATDANDVTRPNDAVPQGEKSLLDRLSYSPIVVLLIAILLVLIVPPLIYLIQTSFYNTNDDGSFGSFTTRFYIELVTAPRFVEITWTTFLYSIGSAAIAIILGVGQAWIVERTNTPLRQYVFLFAIISLGIPHVLYTVSWLLILGKSGPVTEFLRVLFNTDAVVFDVYSLAGMTLVEGLTYTPLAFLLISSVFRAADAAFEEASLMSGAGIRETFQNITLKLAMPAVLALMMLIVIRAFESFEVPALVGIPGGVYVLSTDIYDAINENMPPLYGQAGAFSVGLLAIVIVMLYFYNRLSRHAERYQTITGKGYRPRPMNLGPWRYLTASVLVLFFIMLIVLPVVVLLWASLMPYHQHFSIAALQNLTVSNYVDVFKSQSLRGSVVNTLILGAGTATLVAAFTALCAWFAVRRFRGAWLLDQLATMPLIFPAIVMGVAFLQVFLQLPFAFYGTLASIILASVVRYLPYGMRYSYAGILQIHTELEEASSISGARQASTFLRIVMPLVAPAMVTCWLFVFLLAVRAVSLPILLVGPDSQVVAVSIFEMWENGQITQLAALGIVWMSFMTMVSTAFYLAAKRYGLTVS
jgi:iron(III) transport system permease protein